MSEEIGGIQELRLEDLIPFSIPTQTYRGERLEQLVDSIKRLGLMNPIIVRPIDDGKYEIISGHNRVQAMKELGRDTIRADVRVGLSDDEAKSLFYDSNLNQQSFTDWNYTQKIRAIQYYIELMEENKQQGKRNDKNSAVEDGTCVQNRHKSDKNSKRRPTIRDRMAKKLSISTALFSKYKAIAKLPNEQMESIVCLLDERRITFEIAYTMTKLDGTNLEWLLEELDQSTDSKVDLSILRSSKSLMKCKEGEGRIPVRSREMIKDLLIPKNPNSSSFSQVRRPTSSPE